MSTWGLKEAVGWGKWRWKTENACDIY